MSIKDWSFGRKLMLFVGVLLTIDMAGLAVIIVVSRTPGNPLSKVFESLRDRGDKDDPDADTIIAESSEILKHDKDNIKALERRANAYYEKSLNKLALADYEHLIRLQPAVAKWLKLKGDVLQGDNPGLAIEAYSKAIAMAGPSFETLIERADCYRTLEKKELALKDLHATAQIKLTCEQLNKRASLYQLLELNDLFVADLKSSIKSADGSDYDRRLSMRDLYKFYVKGQNYKLAFDSLKRFITSISVRTDVNKSEYGAGLQFTDLKMIADLELVMGDSEDSIKHYYQALKSVEALVAKSAGPSGEYYTLDFEDLANEVKIARLLRDQKQIDKIESDVTAKALSQMSSGRRFWYGGLVELLEILPPARRDQLGQATVKCLEPDSGKGDYVEFDRIKALILLGRKDEARVALTKISDTKTESFSPVPLYLMLGDYKQVLQLLQSNQEDSDEMGFYKLRVMLSTGDIKAAQILAKQLCQAESIVPDDYLLLSQVAAANHDLAESKRLKKIAAALGQFDALMDIRNGKL